MLEQFNNGLISSKRRDVLEVYAHILETALEGATKTRIIYMANLNFTMAERHLSVLLNAQLIERKNGIYRTTDKGVEYLENYWKLKSLIREFRR